LCVSVTMLVLLSYGYLGYCAPIDGSLPYARSGTSPATPLNSRGSDGEHSTCCDCSAVSLDHLMTQDLPRLEPSGRWQSKIVPTSLKPSLRQIDPPPRAAFI
jgi:hypothetical protein